MWGGSFLIEYPAQKLFYTLLLLVNLNVSIMISWVVEERNDLGFKCYPVMLPDLGIFERIFPEKLFMVLLSSMGLSESLIASYQHLSLFYLTGSDGICGVSMDEVECHLLGSNLLQDQRLDPQVYTHIYD